MTTAWHRDCGYDFCHGEGVALNLKRENHQRTEESEVEESEVRNRN